jgi:hypothetical protein
VQVAFFLGDKKVNRILSLFAAVCILSLVGCGSSNSQQANANAASQPVNEVAAAPKPTPTDVPVLGVSKPYQIGEPKGGCSMIVIYDKDGSVRTMASCKSDDNGNVVAIQPMSKNLTATDAAGIFLKP